MCHALKMFYLNRYLIDSTENFGEAVHHSCTTIRYKKGTTGSIFTICMGENPHGMFARTCCKVLSLPTHDLRPIPLARVATSYVEMSSVAPGEAYFIS